MIIRVWNYPLDKCKLKFTRLRMELIWLSKEWIVGGGYVDWFFYDYVPSRSQVLSETDLFWQNRRWKQRDWERSFWKLIILRFQSRECIMLNIVSSMLKVLNHLYLGIKKRNHPLLLIFVVHFFIYLFYRTREFRLNNETKGEKLSLENLLA